ncbi:hypothetical protein I6A60_39170 [Frankia sp. AgB1.9]|uniref:hypothetical protein n=1 Tax=unclassified Frankia TaxID=2632575 RepID=UPI0019317793|nr:MULTISPECIES: hypothetical protein [unclassified Frankia]MBL7553807.1 hypothetical protein [Frankia sp. AgB1.9]MBL7617907.1 hypothetical protein [Frankia sp. AgB1.8]
MIEFYRYADEGPPDESFLAGDGPHVAPGWVALKPGTDEDNPALVYSREAGITHMGIVGNGIPSAGRDMAASSYQGLGSMQAATRRRADATAVEVAEAIDADLFVTDRPYVFEKLAQQTNGVTCLTPDQALPLVGLYLRAQGAYAVYGPNSLGPALARWNRGLLYWVGARQALPAAWRWISACVQHAQGGGDDRLPHLGGSLVQRVERALRSRDAVHLALNQPQNNDTADDALAAFDEAALLLMGAVDASARVAHTVLGIMKPSVRRAGWQNGDWMSEVQIRRSALAAVVAPGTAAEAALTILRLMRNTIHGEAMAAINRRDIDSRQMRTIMSMPGVDQAALLAATGAAGGDASWGISPQRRGIHADAGVLLDRLFHEVVEVLNRLMEETPVEQLAHVALGPANSGPQGGKSDAVWDSANRLAVAWQLGLGGRAEQP